MGTATRSTSTASCRATHAIPRGNRASSPMRRRWRPAYPRVRAWARNIARIDAGGSVGGYAHQGPGRGVRVDQLSVAQPEVPGVVNAGDLRTWIPRRGQQRVQCSRRGCTWTTLIVPTPRWADSPRSLASTTHLGTTLLGGGLAACTIVFAIVGSHAISSRGLPRPPVERTLITRDRDVSQSALLWASRVSSASR